jgi:NitT/TauT family transport system permease protein
MVNKYKKIFLLFILILLWQFTVYLLHIPKYIFPSPIDILNAILQNLPLLYYNSAITLSEALMGFILANLLSFIFAIWISYNKNLEDVILPIAIILKTIPIIAITPLLVLWMGTGFGSRVVTAGLICFFPSLVNILRGVKQTDRNFTEIFVVYSASKFSTFKLLLLPSIAPYVFSALKVSSSLAIVGALVGEFVGANKGLGFLIIVNYYNLNTPIVFTAILITSCAGILFYYFINFIENKVLFWSDNNKFE